MKPRPVVMACLSAFLLALLAGWYLTHHVALRPIDVVRAQEPLDDYDVNYWASLARQRPQEHRACLDFCAAHPRRPNCDPLSQQAFSEQLRRDAARVRALSRALTTPNANAVHAGGK
jgi:hypothetical protein